MKKILSLLVVIVCLPVLAQAQLLLKQSTASAIRVTLTNASTGAAITGITVTNLSIRHVAHSDTTGATTESEACAASGTDHDCVEIGNGVYEVEVAADKLGTLGRYLACPVYTTVQAVAYCEKFMVVDPASYNANVTGSLTSAAGIWAVATSSLTGAGTVGKEVVDALPSAVPGGAGGLPTVNASNHIVGVQADGITASSIAPAAIGSSEAPNLDAAISTRSTFAVKRSTAKVWPIQMFSSTTGLPMTTGTPVCTRRLDTGAFGGSLTETTVDADGFTFVSFASGDMAGTDSVTAKCTMAGARNSYAVFNIQAP